MSLIRARYRAVNTIMNLPSGGGYVGLLDLFPNAAAAYSLRKLRAAYSGAAVRVRRSSDNTEQDIGFVANGDLDTTALTTFVNADVDIYTSDFTSGNEDMAEVNGTGADGQSIGGVDDAYKFTLSGGAVAHYTRTDSSFDNVNSYDVSFDYYIPSGQTINGIRVRTGTTSDGEYDQTTLDAWTSVAIEDWTPTSKTTCRFNALVGSSIDPIDADGDVFYLKNIVITQTTADGHVTTWYDQSLSNDATQTTASNQPMIVSAGSLVTENGKAAIDFDGVNDMLQKDFDPDIAQPLTLFHVRRYISNGIKCALSYNGSTYADINVSSQFRSNYGTYLTPGPSQNTNQGLWYSLANGTSSEIALDGATATSGNAGTNGLEVLTIGSANGILVTELTTQEIIIYPSNQSANRTAIETNINNFYSIYP